MVGTLRSGFGKSLLERVVFRFALRQPYPPAVVMDHNVNVIEVVKGRSGAIERGIVERPFWRSSLPDQLRELTTISFVADSTALGRKIELIPKVKIASGFNARRLSGTSVSDFRQGHPRALTCPNDFTELESSLKTLRQ
jgi:hypothetical protein